MPSFGGHTNPGHGPRGSRYPGTFLLALREALDRLNWQAVAWKGPSVDCVDAQGQSQTIGLENLFRRLRREPRGTWPDLLADLLGSVPPEAAIPPDHLEEVAAQLLVRLGTPYPRDQRETDVWSQVLIDGHLVATLVIDYPSSMSYVTEKMVATSGQDGDYWLERAIDNLRDKTDPIDMKLVHPESGLLQGQFGDAYDSSRALLLDELLPGHEEFGFYVIVPGRDHLLVLPLSEKTLSAAPWLRAIANKTHQEMPYPISPELFWVRRGVWHRFDIEVTGETLVLTPPPEFAEVLAQLQPDLMQSENDEPDTDDSDPVSF